MGKDVFEITINVVKMFAIFLTMVSSVPMLVWAERRGSAFIQNRFGPNRVGPLGLLQLAADAVKFLFKEEFLPQKGVRLIYYAAPIIALVPATLALAAIPLSIPLDIQPFELFGRTWGPYNFLMQGYEFGIGIVFVLGVSSLSAYSILMAGWGSANKFSLLGALRGSAQVISYELALGLSLVGILLVYGTFSFREMIDIQMLQPLSYSFFGNQVTVGWLPNWGVFLNPLGALIFFAAAFAESNRLPFDLPEAENELVAGYHTEYGGMKFNMFFIGEYGHMMVASALLSTLYFGGFACPIPGLWNTWTPAVVGSFWAQTLGAGNLATIVTGLTFLIFLLSKILFFLWVFIWVRWTLPRFRFDQLMNLGWKTMLPWALFNTMLTAVLLYLGHS